MLKRTIIFFILLMQMCFLTVKANEYIEPTVYLKDMDVYIAGQIETEKAGNVTVIVTEKNTSDLIKYVNQISVDNQGRYELLFNTGCADFDLYINDGQETKKQYKGIDYSQRFCVKCELSSEEIRSDLYGLKAEIKKIFQDSISLDIYIAAYDSDKKLINVIKESIPLSGENVEIGNDYSVSVPENARTVKAFAWIDSVPVSSVENIYTKTASTNNIKISKEKDNIYTDGEDIYFVVTASENEPIEYNIIDFWGKSVGNGTFNAKSDGYRWKFPISSPGYYSLEFKYSYSDTDDKKTEHLVIVTDENFDDIDDSPFGINAHLNRTNWGFKAELVDYMALMGAKSIRADYAWKSTEQELGVYSINQSGIDLVKKHNMNMNLATGYGNSLYAGQQWYPWSDEGRNAFANYQIALVDILGDTVTEIDVWNEWYGGGDSNVAVYYNLLKSCYQPLKNKYPNVKMLSNAIYDEEIYPGWYRKVVRNASSYMDGAYPHIYPGNDPENVIPNKTNSIKGINKLWAPLKTIDLYLTEVGASTYENGVSENQQASVLVRSYCIGLANGYQKIYWYDFMDDGKSENEYEYNFGLIHYASSSKGAYSPKPAYAAYAVMARELTGYSAGKVTMIGNGDIYSVTFTRGNEEKKVVWSLNETTLELDREYLVTDIMGNKSMKNKLTVNQYPQYIAY